MFSDCMNKSGSLLAGYRVATDVDSDSATGEFDGAARDGTDFIQVKSILPRGEVP